MKPSSFRTGTATWKKLRAKRRNIEWDNGLTNCPICNTALDWEYSLRPNSAEVDHIIEWSKGGLDTLDNTRVICRNCNVRRSASNNGRKGAAIKQRVKPDTKIRW